MLQLEKGRSILLNFRQNIPGGQGATFRYVFTTAEFVFISGLTSSQSGGIITDIQVTRIDIQRPDVNRRESMILQGGPTLAELTGPNLGLLGLFPAVEKVAPQSQLDIDLFNNNVGALIVSLSLIGYTMTPLEFKEKASETERMSFQQQLSVRQR